MKKMLMTILLVTGLCVTRGLTAEEEPAAQPGADLQEILDGGEDLLLQRGGLYRVSQALRFRKPGQRIATQGARHFSEYATLQIGDPACPQLVNGNGQPEIGRAHV